MKWIMELNQFAKTKAEENNVEQHGKMLQARSDVFFRVVETVVD